MLQDYLNIESKIVAPSELEPRSGTPRRLSDTAGAIVIGGDYLGLGIVRSLGRRGIPVWVLRDEYIVASTSRYARRSLRWPNGDERSRVEYLLDLEKRFQLNGWAIFPTSDEAAALISRNHEVLAERFLLTTPPWEILRWAYDKRLTYSLASQIGVEHPWTYYPRSREDLLSLDCSFPVILKPAMKVELNDLTDAKAWRVENRRELMERYDEACPIVEPDIIMVQELIPGGGEAQFSYAALCVNGDPVASLVARRTRQYPMDFGRNSTFVETISCPEIEEPARRLLAAMEYDGLVEVEFKRDHRDGNYKLLDVNGRVWGWHTLGARAGVDFPYLVWRVMDGQTVPRMRGRTGVRWLRMATDIPAAVQEIRNGKLSLAAYLWSLRGPLRFAIFEADDPYPALADVPLLIRRGGRRKRRDLQHPRTTLPPQKPSLPR